MVRGPIVVFGTLVLVTVLAVSPTASADAEVVVSEGQFTGHGDHSMEGTVQIVALAGGGHEVRFGSDFLFTFGHPPGQDFLHFDVRILSASEPSDQQALLAQTPVPGLLGQPDAVLGPLQSFEGAQTYAVPAGTDVAALGSVVVHCVDFQFIMGHATLEDAE